MKKTSLIFLAALAAVTTNFCMPDPNWPDPTPPSNPVTVTTTPSTPPSIDTGGLGESILRGGK